MTPSEIGLVFNQLVERRVLYSFAVSGRSRSQEEKEAVACLEHNRDSHEELEEFLETQGLRLVSHEAAALHLGAAGRVYVAVRDPLQGTPSHIGGPAVLREMSDSRRRSESTGDGTLWAGLLLMTMLKLLYTDYSRPIEAVSGFVEAEFDDAQFVETLLGAIEIQRGASIPDNPAALRAHNLFTESKESQVTSRATGFLRNMVAAGVIEERDTRKAGTVYGQTLWSAVDVAENFKRYTGGLLLHTAAPDVAALVSADVAPVSEN